MLARWRPEGPSRRDPTRRTAGSPDPAQSPARWSLVGIQHGNAHCVPSFYSSSVKPLAHQRGDAVVPPGHRQNGQPVRLLGRWYARVVLSAPGAADERQLVPGKQWGHTPVWPPVRPPSRPGGRPGQAGVFSAIQLAQSCKAGVEAQHVCVCAKWLCWRPRGQQFRQSRVNSVVRLRRQNRNFKAPGWGVGDPSSSPSTAAAGEAVRAA